ncbi:MAG: hypothetical protein RSF88_07825, partial [Lachnospiraceae bacterium]
YRKLLKVLENSKVDIYYRITEYRLITYNLGLVEALNHDTSQACELFKQGMRTCMEAGRVSMIGRFLFAMGWTLSEAGEEKNKKKTCKMLQQAFYISNILNQPNLNQNVQCYYQEKWDEFIKY